MLVTYQCPRLFEGWPVHLPFELILPWHCSCLKMSLLLFAETMCLKLPWALCVVTCARRRLYLWLQGCSDLSEHFLIRRAAISWHCISKGGSERSTNATLMALTFPQIREGFSGPRSRFQASWIYRTRDSNWLGMGVLSTPLLCASLNQNSFQLTLNAINLFGIWYLSSKSLDNQRFLCRQTFHQANQSMGNTTSLGAPAGNTTAVIVVTVLSAIFVFLILAIRLLIVKWNNYGLDDKVLILAHVSSLCAAFCFWELLLNTATR